MHRNKIARFCIGYKMHQKMVDLTRFSIDNVSSYCGPGTSCLYPHGRRISAKKITFTPKLQSTTSEQRPAANNGGVSILTARGKAAQGVA